MNKNKINSFATSINRTYYVSTAFRESSATYYPVKYYETFVWTLDADGQLDTIIYQCSSGSMFKNVFKDHTRLVKIFMYLVERKLRNTI
jgi:hypothetical protein